MKNVLFKLGVPVLLLYSIFIVIVELQYGQTGVREYLTDINGSGPFYGLNTTFTTILLTLTSYNFILCALRYHKKEKGRNLQLLFFIIQALIFLYLALDERFKVHERVGGKLGIDDAYVLGLVGVGELVVLYYFKELLWNNTLKSYALYLGGLCFGIMILIDAFGAKEGLLRLSFEDLSKTWAIFFLFIYSFETFRVWSKKSSQS
ncbi:hypothetical protein [Spongiimicrobium salis]|uniref:hypothetical protein n=1 Tax=Spongiimicrobium salis TaxID=1667022 RepID=UPI00374D72C3